MKDLDLIYATARKLPAEERPDYLTKACGGDNGLRKRLEQMLAVEVVRSAWRLHRCVIAEAEDGNSVAAQAAVDRARASTVAG